MDHKSIETCSRQSVGGIVNQAISAIENALWDAKAKKSEYFSGFSTWR